MYKLTTECEFQINQNLFKQAECCSMGRPLSVTLADIHMIRTEKDIVTLLKPIFYKRFVDDIYNRRKKGNTDLYRAKLIAWNLDNELVIIKKKFLAADYPNKFINSVIKTFIEKENQKEEEYLIPQNFFEIPKPIILIEIPFCVKNEIASKQFIKKFNHFTNYKFDGRIKWLSRKTRTLFQLKDKSLHPACRIYEGTCICGEKYVGQTKRNFEIRWMEHNTPNDKSNPTNHLIDNIDHSFTWKVICNLRNRKLTRKILEAYFIATMKPSPNDQIDSGFLHLFKNGIT